MNRILMLTLVVALLSLLQLNVLSQTTNEYTYISDTRGSAGTKIGKSTLNLYLDTTDFIYQGCFLPNSYRNQNLKDGVYHQYFLQDTTKIAFELTYQNRQLKGFKSYWFNDTLKQTGQLTHGMNEGTWTGYYRSGSIREVFYWTQGFHHEFILYHPNGNPERHGKELEIGNGKYRLWDFVFYHENGQPSEKGQIKNSSKIGTWNYYNEDGTIRETKNHTQPDWLRPADGKK